MTKRLFHLLLIAVIGFLAYANTFHVPFSFDDRFQIVGSPIIRGIDTFISAEKESYTGYNKRRYIGYLTLAFNYELGGLNVTGYHLVNLSIHIINAMLVYFLVVLTFRTPYFQGPGTGNQGPEIITQKNPAPSPQSPVPKWIGLFSALLFVSHPVQTQAVTYIVQRLTSLAALFYLLSMVLYINGRLKSQSAEGKAQGDKTAMRHALGPVLWYLFALLSAVCAMKTKEIAFTLPVMIVLYEFIFFGGSLKKKLLFLIPVLLTLLIIPLSVMQMDKPLGELLSDLSERSRQQTDMPRGDYLMTQMRVIVTYLRLLVLPVNQNLEYDYPVYRSFFSPSVILSFLLLSALFGTAIYLLYKTRSAEGKAHNVESPMPYAPGAMRLAAFGILWFFITLSVESSVIPIVDVIFEHRVYLPSAGAFIAVAAAFAAAAGKGEKKWARAGKAAVSFMVIIAAFSAATVARNRVWQDEVTLWEDTVKKSPGSARAHNNLGFLYTARGMYDQAVAQFLSSLFLMPDYADARINLGIAYHSMGMHDEAIAQFLTVLQMDPGDADAHNNLGVAYVSKGLIEEGIGQYQAALKLRPDYAEPYNGLGVAYGSQGMLDPAIQYFRQAIVLQPDYAEARYNLALAYIRKNDLAGAEAEYYSLAKINPDMAKRLPLITKRE